MTQLLLAVHVAGGSLALLTMFIPMVTKKGGPAHRRAGWLFVAGMTGVSITALGLAGIRLWTDPTPAGQFAGRFLLFIAVLTGAGVSAGVRVLRFKRRTAAHRHVWDLGVAAVLTVTSVAAALYGLRRAEPLFTGFAVVGLLSGAGQLAYWLRPPAHPMHWWFEHLGAMLGSCIAATTAFLVVNSAALGAGTFSLALWFGPTLVGVPAIAAWNVYYRRRFAPMAARSAAGQVPAAPSS